MRYSAYFCEENVWHLCLDDAIRAGRSAVAMEDRRVVFISNALRVVPMRHQRAGNGGLVHWDYHVVLFARSGPMQTGVTEPVARAWEVWDLDCELGLPLPIETWLRASFPVLDVELAPCFRVVDAASFVAGFSSDRSHMLDEHGRPRQPFPTWPLIQTASGEMNLMRYVDVTSVFAGEVLHLADVRSRFGVK